MLDHDCRERRPDILVLFQCGSAAVIEAQSGSGKLDEWHFLKSLWTYPWRVHRDLKVPKDMLHVGVLCGSCHTEHLQRIDLGSPWASVSVIECTDRPGKTSFKKL